MNGLVKEGSIGAILFKSQIITEQELKSALEAQKLSGCRIGEALVRLGIVTQEDIDWALSHQLNIPYVRLKKENVDSAAVAKVTPEVARRYDLFPVFLSGNELSVAMADPLNEEAVEELERATGCQITISVALIREIREMQDLIYGSEQLPSLGFRSGDFAAKVLEGINADLSGATLLNHLLLRVVKQKFSSLTLQPVCDEVVVLARRQGETAEIGRLPATYYGSLTDRIRKLARVAPSQGASSTGLLTFMWQGKRIPFQALLMAAAEGAYITLKLQIAPPPLSVLADLRLPPSKEEALLALVAERQGLILFAGRDADQRSRIMDLFLDAGDHSGKSVLLLGERLGRGGKRFARIRVSHDGFDDTPSVISAALEHDPDLLVIEDVTEVPSFIAASKAILRGKLVFAGLAHADKGGVLRQLLYLRQKNYLIPTQVRGVVCCKELLLLCPKCKERYQPEPEELAALRLPHRIEQFYRPNGCPDCDHTGYSGRRYLLDVIRFDKVFLEAFEMICRSADIISFMKESGYRGITEEGIELLQRGEISPGEYIASILL